MRAQRPHRALGELGQRLGRVAVPGPVMGQEVRREQRDVVGPLAQRRHVDRHDAQAVVKILAQETRSHGFFHRAVRGGDEPHVHDRIRRFAADAPHHAILDHSEQLRLNRLGHLDELVQEHRAAVGGLEQPGFVTDRAGERPLHVAEHLRLEQRLGKRGAVDRHERPTRAAAVLVDELGDELLARSALAGDERRGVRRRDAARQRHDVAEHRRGPEHRERVAGAVGEGLRPERARLAPHHDRVHRSTDENLELGRGERLGEVIPRARAQRLEARLDARLPGHDDDDRLAPRRQRRAQQLHPRDLAHEEIHEDDVELATLQQLARLLAAPAHRNGVALDAEHAGATLAQRSLVVHDEDAHARLGRGVDCHQLRKASG